MFSKWVSLIWLCSGGWLAADFLDDGVIASDSPLCFLAASEPKASVAPLPQRPSPGQTVDDLVLKSTNTAEPSQKSEEVYIGAIRLWLNSLEPVKRELARKIMVEAHPGLHALREAIRHKKSQLASISFDKGMPPERLPRLGMELQQLRASLNRELKRVQERLRYEAGVEMDSVKGDTFWLSLPPEAH